MRRGDRSSGQGMGNQARIHRRIWSSTTGRGSIRYLHSTLVPNDEAAVCVFDAASAELVEQLHARAGVPFDRIVNALEI